MNVIFLPLGIAFGFLLSRAGATTYDFYAKLFLFQDFHLLWVMLVAAAIGVVGVALIKRAKVTTSLVRQSVNLSSKPYVKTLIPGSLIFGVGWGIAGACPGTALAMLGEGKLGAGVTIVGILIGTWLFGVTGARRRAKAAG